MVKNNQHWDSNLLGPYTFYVGVKFPNCRRRVWSSCSDSSNPSLKMKGTMYVRHVGNCLPVKRSVRSVKEFNLH
jgi:hypothetical protein